MLGYVVAIWKGLLRQSPRPRRVPLVVPLVLHHGPRGWTAATDLLDLLEFEGLPPELLQSVLPLQPTFRYRVQSLVGASSRDVRGLAISVLGKLTLAALQFLPGAPPRRILAGIGDWADLVSRVLLAPSGHEAIAALSMYVLRTTTVVPEQLIEVVERVVDPEVTMKLKSAAAQLHARGMAEGKAEGKAEGSLAGRTELLLGLLQARFGSVPESVRERLAGASAADLDRWAIRCLDAASLDQVFAAD